MVKRKSSPLPRVDVAANLRKWATQFQGLNPNDPAVWPPIPRYLLFFCVAVLAMVALWFVWLTSVNDELEAERSKELTLRQDYQKKVAQAVNLELLKQQREEVQQYVTLLEKQLPSKAEMDALLSDINQAGLGRSLQFELFRPGQIVLRDYYAELPITLRVSGRYHDMGAFASDVAHLSRIVTLNNVSIVPSKDGGLTMDATARTYRYLDAEEQASQKRAAQAAAAKKR